MADPKTEKPSAPSARLARATVARGRTVMVPNPAKKKVVGHTPEGRPIEQAELVAFGPGQEVELPGDEIMRLRRQGYLVDPDQGAAGAPEGAKVSEVSRL